MLATLQLDHLKEAHRAFLRPGKFQIEDALNLLDSLKLNAQVDGLIRGQIHRLFDRDAFAGFLRYDGIVQLIEIETLRQSK